MNPPAAGPRSHRLPLDPRPGLFAELLKAADRGDALAVRRIRRELRRLGLSVAVVADPPGHRAAALFCELCDALAVPNFRAAHWALRELRRSGVHVLTRST